MSESNIVNAFRHGVRKMVKRKPRAAAPAATSATASG